MNRKNLKSLCIKQNGILVISIFPCLETLSVKFLCLLFETSILVFRNIEHFSHFRIFRARSWSNTVDSWHHAVSRERLGMQTLCEWTFRKVLIVSSDSVRTWELFILRSKDLSLFEHWSRTPHELFFSVALRNRESISKVLLSYTRLIHLQSSLVNWKSHVVVIYCFCKVRPFVLTCSSSIRGVDMVGVDF